MGITDLQRSLIKNKTVTASQKSSLEKSYNQSKRKGQTKEQTKTSKSKQGCGKCKRRKNKEN